MPSLEEALREATEHGHLSGLTLWTTEGRYQANARWKGSEGWTVIIGADPVAALVGALTGAANYDPNAGRRSPAPAPQSPPPAPTAGVFD